MTWEEVETVVAFIMDAVTWILRGLLGLAAFLALAGLGFLGFIYAVAWSAGQ